MSGLAYNTLNLKWIFCIFCACCCSCSDP